MTQQENLRRMQDLQRQQMENPTTRRTTTTTTTTTERAAALDDDEPLKLSDPYSLEALAKNPFYKRDFSTEHTARPYYSIRPVILATNRSRRSIPARIMAIKDEEVDDDVLDDFRPLLEDPGDAAADDMVFIPSEIWEEPFNMDLIEAVDKVVGILEEHGAMLASIERSNATDETLDRLLTNRPKRGIAGVAAAITLGSLLLFPPKTGSDEKLVQLAEKLTAQTGMLTQIAGEQASLLNVNIRATQTQAIAIAQLSNITHLFLLPAVSNTSEFSSAVRQMHLALQSTQFEVRRFMTAWHLANTEQTLSPYFLDPARLVTTLETLQNSMPPGLSLPVEPVNTTNVHFYYAAITARPHFANNVTYLLLHVPLVFKDRVMTIYEGVPWPYIAPGAGDIFTYFVPETKYLATNDERTVHVLLTQDDISLCDFEREIRICHPKVAVYKDRYSCAFALLQSEQTKVASLCEAYFSRTAPPRFLAYRGGQSWVYSIQKPTTLTMVYPNATAVAGTRISIPTTGIIHIPSNQIAKVDNILLYAGSSLEHTVRTSDNIILPVLPLIKVPNFKGLSAASNITWEKIRTALGSTNASDHELVGVSSSRIQALLNEAQPGQRHLFELADHLVAPTQMRWYHWVLIAAVVLAALGACACFKLYELVPPTVRGAITVLRFLCWRERTNRRDNAPASPRELKRLHQEGQLVRVTTRDTPRLAYTPDF